MRRVLAEKYEVKPDNVMVGSGSDSIMANIVRTFLCDDDEVLTIESAFIGFQVLAKSRGVATGPFLTTTGDMICRRSLLRSPNVPRSSTSRILTIRPERFHASAVRSFYRHVPERVLIILDEAYFEYARTDPRYPDSMFYRHDNVITLRTFSKAYGLAGLRIGYGFAHEELIRNLLKVKLPFEPGTLAAAAAVGALGDTAFLYRTLELNARGLRCLTNGLREMGLQVIDSWANFVTVV